MIASSSHTEVNTQRVSKCSVKGSKHQTPLMRNSELCVSAGMAWAGAAVGSSEGGFPSALGNVCVLVINEPLDSGSSQVRCHCNMGHLCSKSDRASSLFTLELSVSTREKAVISHLINPPLWSIPSACSRSLSLFLWI